MSDSIKLPLSDDVLLIVQLLRYDDRKPLDDDPDLQRQWIEMMRRFPGKNSVEIAADFLVQLVPTEQSERPLTIHDEACFGGKSWRVICEVYGPDGKKTSTSLTRYCETEIEADTWINDLSEKEDGSLAALPTIQALRPTLTGCVENGVHRHTEACYAERRKATEAMSLPHYSVEEKSRNNFVVYGNYLDTKGKPVRFVAMRTWSQDRADKWIAERGIAADGRILYRTSDDYPQPVYSCENCGAATVGWYVPDEVWARLPETERSKQLCFACFERCGIFVSEASVSQGVPTEQARGHVEITDEMLPASR